MVSRPTREPHGTDPAVPNTAGAWIGYVGILVAVAITAATLTAFAYGFAGWGVIGAIAAVLAFAASAVLLARAGRHNFDRYLNRDREA